MKHIKEYLEDMAKKDLEKFWEVKEENIETRNWNETRKLERMKKQKELQFN